MPDASNPSLGRAESSALNGTPTPSMSSKTLPNLNLTTTTSNTNTQNNKGGKVAPKVDVELVYTELKKAVGEGWVVYKEAVAGFVLGECNYDAIGSDGHAIEVDIVNWMARSRVGDIITRSLF